MAEHRFGLPDTEWQKLTAAIGRMAEAYDGAPDDATFILDFIEKLYDIAVEA